MKHIKQYIRNNPLFGVILVFPIFGIVVISQPPFYGQILLFGFLMLCFIITLIAGIVDAKRKLK